MFPQIFGKYVLEREIAAGGMARVYLATLRGAGGFEKRLVVKQIRAELASDEAFVRRFVEEAKTAVELSHPNIVPVYELGVEQGVYFIAMELCEGTSLAELLAATGPLSAEEGAYVGIEICRALDYAHRRAEVVHRDVTPRNVMIDGEGAVRLIDFGIAAPVAVEGDEDGERIEVFGSPGHMAPEQMDGRPLTAATDVFAVAALLIEAWTGRPPFRRATPAECRKAMREPPEPLAAGLPELEPLAELVGRAVAFDPAARVASPEELARPLRRFVRSFDLGDVARRLGERVRQTTARQSSNEAWLPGDGLSEALETPPLDAPIETKTFAAHHDFAEWTSPSTRKLPSEPDLEETLRSEDERTSQREVGSITTSGARRSSAGGWLAAAAIVGLVTWLGVRSLGERAVEPPAARSSPEAVAEPPKPTPPTSSTTTAAPVVSASAAPKAGKLAPAASIPRPAAVGPCRLNVSSIPPGAVTSIDGRGHGTTPVFGIELPCATHTVVLDHAAVADSVSLSVRLSPNAARNVIVDWSGAARKVIIQ